jgi:serine protease Do
VRPIQLNQPVDAIYMPGETREVYVFTSDRAHRVGIDLAAQDGAGDLRLEAQLYDETDALIPKITAPIGQPSLRDVWDIPGPGIYTVRVFGAETEARAFELAVYSLPVPEIGGGVLACGKSRSGEIAVRGQRDQWLFEGQAGEQVTITMLAPGKDGVLEVYDPAQKLIGHSDDTPQFGANPALEIVLPKEGTYTIVARMYGDEHAGTYRLVLACARSED